MDEDTPIGREPASWTPRLAVERYVRERLVGSGPTPTGVYAVLRPFADWCLNRSIGSVGDVARTDLLAYAVCRARAVSDRRLDRELEIVREFCKFLEALGATDGIANGHHRRRDPTAATADPVESEREGRTPDGGWTGPRLVGAAASQGDRFTYRIGPEESVPLAVVRGVSAIDGRRPSFLPPIRNVLDPEALTGLFEDRPDGTPRTGGRVSFVYASCRVVLDGGEHLTIEPLTHGSERDPTTVA